MTSAAPDNSPTMPFDEASLAAYIAADPELSAFFDHDLEGLRIREIGDGNLNFVFHVARGDRALAIKQALPYSRMSGGTRALTCERLVFETAALQEFARHAPAHVPAVHHFNARRSLLAQEFLSPHLIMRKGMMDGIVYPCFADHMSSYLANCLFSTSDFGLAASDKRRMVARFAGNIELCEITERLVFTEPFTVSANNRWTSPELDADAAAIRGSLALKRAVCELKLAFLTRADALLHADLHTGSIMLTETDTRVIDPEFAVFGPMGFDIGMLIGNLLLNCFAQLAYEGEGTDRAGYRRFILAAVEDLWSGFAAKFTELWHSRRRGDAYPASLFEDPAALDEICRAYLSGVLVDALGFAGVEMIRRTLGRAHTPDYDAIADAGLRSRSEKLALALAVDLVTSLRHSGDIKVVVSAAQGLLAKA
jgi:5-methylthioribose kinase